MDRHPKGGNAAVMIMVFLLLVLHPLPADPENVTDFDSETVRGTATAEAAGSLGSAAPGQDPFTKVTEGAIVSDGGRSQGIALADYDDDGYLDVFVTNLNTDIEEDNFLYRNNGDGSFTKITDGILVNDGGHSRGASWGDYDNDGDLDLFVVNFPPQERLFYENDGDGTFTKITSGPAVTDTTGSSSPGWADYDRDGDLDLYIATSLDESQGPYGDCSNSLYRNDDGSLVEVTEGDLVHDLGASYCTGWSDYDSDGDLDLFVTEAGTRCNQLYNNDGDGTFTKVTSGILVNDVGESFGASWGDYDNDGDPDLFVTNVDYDTEGKNFLYRNLGNGDFEKITEGSVVNDEAYSFGSCWGDYDNDGDMDLFVANCPDAHGTGNHLYENRGDGTFERVTASVVETDADWSYGAAWGDYDNDGDLDLFVANFTGGSGNNAVYRNNGNDNNWISIKCLGTESNRSAIGTKVRIRAVIDGIPLRQFREITSQSGFCGQNSMSAHFGLGDAQTVDSLVVEWPLGLVQVWTDVGVNRFLTVTEGIPVGIGDGKPESVLPKSFSLFQNHPNPFNPRTAITFHLSRAAKLDLSIYDIKGRLVRSLATDEVRSAGRHSIVWDGTDKRGRNAGSGVYFYRMTVDGRSTTRKMLLLK